MKSILAGKQIATTNAPLQGIKPEWGTLAAVILTLHTDGRMSDAAVARASAAVFLAQQLPNASRPGYARATLHHPDGCRPMPHRRAGLLPAPNQLRGHRCHTAAFRWK